MPRTTLRDKLSGKSPSRFTRHSGRAGTRHDHKFVIGDQDAFLTLMEKNTATLNGDARKRLVRAVQDATRRFHASNSKERDAFLHGLVTGYAVGFKLAEECAEEERDSGGRQTQATPRSQARARAAAAGTMGVA